MGFFDFIRPSKGKSVLVEEPSSNDQQMKFEIALSEKLEFLYTNTYIFLLSFYSNVNRIANAFCKCTFETYTDGKEVKDEEWYTWNVQPNKNQNAYEFKNKLITKLYENNEALVIALGNGDLYVADSYNKKEYVLFENIFENVQIGDMSFSRTFMQSEVLFFRLNDVNIKILIDKMADMMQKLTSTAMESYIKSKGEKVVMDVSQIARGTSTFQKDFIKLMEEDFKSYFDKSDKVVMPLFEGYEINDKSKKPDFSTTPNDIQELITTTSNQVAKAINVPIALDNGDAKDIAKVMDEFLTVCIDPLVEMIKQEILRKRYNLELIKNGDYLTINSKSIKHIDLFDVSTSIEKLISSACFCVNDIRRALGMSIIDEPWANEFFITKNFSKVEDLLNFAKGGENNE